MHSWKGRDSSLDNSFGKKIRMRLIDLDKNQIWLIEQVRSKTGLYFDGSYLWKIMNGVSHTPRIVSAIRDILDI